MSDQTPEETPEEAAPEAPPVNPYDTPSASEDDSASWMPAPGPSSQSYSAGGYPPPPGYGSPGYPMPGGLAPEHPNTVTVLIMGIFGLILCQLAAPFAWFMGGKARKEVRNSGGAYRESASLTIGWILGIIGTALLALIVLLFGLFLGLGIFAASTTSDHLNKMEDDNCMGSYTYCGDEDPFFDRDYEYSLE